MIKYIAVFRSYGYQSMQSGEINPLTIEKETKKTVYIDGYRTNKINQDYRICDTKKETQEYLIEVFTEKRKSIVRTIKAKEAEHFEIEQKLMDLKGDK